MRRRDWNRDRDATTLEVFGEGHTAWDMSGFTPEQRTRQLEHVARLLRTLFAERLTLAAEATSSGGLFGFPRDLLLSILGNAEGREQLLRRFPALEGLLVERACLTNDLETEFSTIVRRCGCKAALAMVLGALHSVDTLFTVRRGPTLSLFPPAAGKASYNQQQQGVVNATAWHDGSSERPSDTVWRRRTDEATQQALRTVGAQATVRDYTRGSAAEGRQAAAGQL